MKKTRDFASVIRRKLAKDADLKAAVEREAFNANVATQIYEARRAAKLTQTQLADRIGSHQSVIARLEDADYDGHSLSMIWKIANALGCTIGVEFYPRCKPIGADVVTTTTISTSVTISPQDAPQYQLSSISNALGDTSS